MHLPVQEDTYSGLTLSQAEAGLQFNLVTEGVFLDQLLELIDYIIGPFQMARASHTHRD
jgi:hypothetical protein